MNDKIRECINTIIREETGFDPLVIDSSSPIRELVSLDSMQFVSLVAKIEIELEMELPISIMNISTLDEFYREIDIVFQIKNK